MSKTTIRQWLWTVTTALAFGATGWLLGQSGWGSAAVARAAVHEDAATPAPEPALPGAGTDAAPMDADRGLAASQVDDASRLMQGDQGTRFDTVLQTQKAGADAVPQAGTVAR